MAIGITLIVVGILAIFFFISLWHTFHGDMVPMLVTAVITLIGLGVIFILGDVLGIVDWVLGLF